LSIPCSMKERNIACYKYAEYATTSTEGIPFPFNYYGE
jgi:hypothetical protein